MLAKDLDQCVVWTREIARMETQLAAHDPTALADVVRHRIAAWATWRKETVGRTLNLAVAGELASLEPQLVALAPTLAELIGRYPEVGPALESLLDQLLVLRRIDAIAWNAPVPNAAALHAAFRKCAAFLEHTAMGFAPSVAMLIRHVNARNTTPLAWSESIGVSDSESLHVRWLLHVAGLHGYRAIDFDRPEVLDTLLEPERVARELQAAALGCAVVADELAQGIVPVNMLDEARGAAADALTRFMHAQTGRWLYETVGVLMRGTLPRITKGWRLDADLEPYVRAAAKAHRKRAAAYERAGKPSFRKDRPNERWHFTPHGR